MSACTLALVLLLDASASILPPDWTLQTQGHAAAFEDPVVHRAISRGDGVAVTALSFSDDARVMIGWRVLHDRGEATGFAAALREAPRGVPAGTDIGGALIAAMERLEEAPCEAGQRVIDLATDGEANPRRAQEARSQAEARGVRINAIGVASDRAGEWLRENAVTSGGFVMEAPDWPSFAAAIRRKVTLELALPLEAPALDARRAHREDGAGGTPCPSSSAPSPAPISRAGCPSGTATTPSMVARVGRRWTQRSRG